MSYQYPFCSITVDIPALLWVYLKKKEKEVKRLLSFKAFQAQDEIIFQEHSYSLPITEYALTTLFYDS